MKRREQASREEHKLENLLIPRRLEERFTVDCPIIRISVGHRLSGVRSERCFQKGAFKKVLSAFESWQVFRHMTLCVELHTIALYVIIACVLSPYAACALRALPVCINWLLFE
jgi:hypothetical protein